MPNDLNTNLALILNGLGAMPSGSVGVRLSAQTTPVSNAGTAETDLMTYALPASALNSNNQSLRITAMGTFAATANVKTVRLYFGTTELTNNITTTCNLGSWQISAQIVRVGATSQVAWGRLIYIASGFTLNDSERAFNRTPAETLTSAVTIKVTGTSGTASADVTQTAMIVEWLP